MVLSITNSNKPEGYIKPGNAVKEAKEALYTAFNEVRKGNPLDKIKGGLRKDQSLLKQLAKKIRKQNDTNVNS